MSRPLQPPVSILKFEPTDPADPADPSTWPRVRTFVYAFSTTTRLFFFPDHHHVPCVTAGVFCRVHAFYHGVCLGTYLGELYRVSFPHRHVCICSNFGCDWLVRRHISRLCAAREGSGRVSRGRYKKEEVLGSHFKSSIYYSS